MQSKATTVEAYLASLGDDRRGPVTKLHEGIVARLPEGFVATMSYGAIGYVVPHTRYPAGYHCDPKLPLPFMGLASQKGYVSVYHMGLYAGPLLDWLQAAWAKTSKGKLDVGKGCVRFKKVEALPYDLVGELASKMTVDEWVRHYEASLKR